MNSDGIDRTIIGWRAWYTEGRVFDSVTSKWEELPEDGVLGVMVYYKTRPQRRMMVGRTLYWREETDRGAVYCNDDSADAIISAEARATFCVKHGKWVADEEMAETVIKMQAAQDAP